MKEESTLRRAFRRKPTRTDEQCLAASGRIEERERKKNKKRILVDIGGGMRCHSFPLQEGMGFTVEVRRGDEIVSVWGYNPEVERLTSEGEA